MFNEGLKSCLSVPPATPSRCQAPPNATTSNGFIIRCRAGFDGGIPQRFRASIHVRDDDVGHAFAEQISDVPEFRFSNLASDTVYVAVVSSENAKGVSDEVRLEVATGKDLRRQQRPLEDIKLSYSAGKTQPSSVENTVRLSS